MERESLLSLLLLLVGFISPMLLLEQRLVPLKSLLESMYSSLWLGVDRWWRVRVSEHDASTRPLLNVLLTSRWKFMLLEYSWW